MADSLLPGVGEAAVRVLRAAGVEPVFDSRQTCCGQPLFNGGFHDLARRQAIRTIEVLEATDDFVVVPSGSCAAMIRHGFPDLLGGDSALLERAERLARRTYELSEFLVEMIGWAPVPQDVPPLVYHASCHLQRGLGIDRQPLFLLEHLTGAPATVLAPECCGFGGLFSIEQPEISGAMLERRSAQIESLRAEVVVGGDVGCLMHLEGGLRRKGSKIRCVHLAQALVGDWGGLR